jgi:hypothetical protein
MLDSAHLSKRLDIHPGNLADVAGRWHRGLERMPWSSRMVRVSSGFWLASGSTGSAHAYEVDGVVWTSGRPVPLILEFSGWSKTQSEVGICPRSLLWPVGTERYIRRVMAVLENVSHSVYLSTLQVEAPYEPVREPAARPERIWRSLPVPAHS